MKRWHEGSWDTGGIENTTIDTIVLPMQASYHPMEKQKNGGRSG